MITYSVKIYNKKALNCMITINLCSFFFQIKVLNEWTIVDDKKNTLVCFIYPVEIVDNKALGRQKYETIR